MANLWSNIIEQLKNPTFSLESLSNKDLLVIFRQSIMKTEILIIISDEKKLLEHDKSPYQFSKFFFLGSLETCVVEINAEIEFIMEKLLNYIEKTFHQFKLLKDSRKDFHDIFENRIKATFVDDLIAESEMRETTMKDISTCLYGFLINSMMIKKCEIDLKFDEHRKISRRGSNYFFKNYGSLDKTFLKDANKNMIYIEGIYEELNVALITRNDARKLPRKVVNQSIDDSINIVSFGVAFRLEMVIIDNFLKSKGKKGTYEEAVEDSSSINYTKLRDKIALVVRKSYSRNKDLSVPDAAAFVFEKILVVIDNIFNFWPLKCKVFFEEKIKNLERRLVICLDRMLLNVG